MVKFRTSASEEPKPESIVLLFQDLNRDPSVKYLYSHQGKILEGYQNHLQSKDLAIELPTGTGKTLVGLLIAEYRRRAFKERVVFLCPTRQLCSQVNERARRYGINTALFVGSQSKYDPGQFYAYQQAKAIAITTYSGVFNTNPRIDDPEVIICDDAHAADNYIADLWTLSISRTAHRDLYMSIYRTLESVIPNSISYRIETGGSSRFDETSVDLISTIAAYGYLTQLGQVLGEFATKYDDLKYSWSILSDHLEACSFYISPKTIEIRPLIPPTQEWFLKINTLLQKWKIVGGNYARQVSSVESNIEKKEATAFENGLDALGKILGARTYQWSGEGAPDGLWIFGNWQAFVFEAKTDENAEDGISLDTVRQARTHEQRVRADNLIPPFVPCSTVVISPRSRIHKLAVPHAEDIAYISHNEVIRLFNDAAKALERVRSSAAGSTEEALQVKALQTYGEQSVGLRDVKDRLLNRKLKDLPKHG